MARKIQTSKPTPRRSPCPKYPVTAACRDYLLETFPSLKEGTDAQAYRGLAAYFLFGTFYDWNSGQLVIPFTTIAQHVGSHPKGKKFNAQDWLTKFNDNVWPIKWSAKDYEKGEARECQASPKTTISNHIFEYNLSNKTEKVQLSKNLVDFVTGDSLSWRQRNKIQKDMQAKITLTPNHPAKDFAEFLNKQPQHAYIATLRRNWSRAVKCLEEMPTETPSEILRKEYGLATLSRIQILPPHYYSGKSKTHRLFAVSPSVNELPREIRKELLHDCVTLDAKSIQLAIASKIWDMPKTYAFLSQEGNIWADVQSYMSIDSVWKSFIKEALYSILFGRSKTDLKYYLETGREPSQRGKESLLSPEKISFSSEQVTRFLDHPIIKECILSQESRLVLIDTNNGITELSGFKRSLDPTSNIDAKSLLAAEVQSYEIALISSLLPILQEYQKDFRIVSFLHDGITLWFNKQSTTQTAVKKIQYLFKEKANKMGIPTELIVGD